MKKFLLFTLVTLFNPVFCQAQNIEVMHDITFNDMEPVTIKNIPEIDRWTSENYEGARFYKWPDGLSAVYTYSNFFGGGGGVIIRCDIGNGIRKTQSDGTVVITYPTQKRIITDEKKHEHECPDDGNANKTMEIKTLYGVEQKFYDTGLSIMTGPDGVFRYSTSGESKVNGWRTLNGKGVLVKHNDDGSIEIQSQISAKVTVYPEGTRRIQKAKTEQWFFLDGGSCGIDFLIKSEISRLKCDFKTVMVDVHTSSNRIKGMIVVNEKGVETRHEINKEVTGGSLVLTIGNMFEFLKVTESGGGRVTFFVKRQRGFIKKYVVYEDNQTPPPL